jgi:hypothetical protein
MMNGCSSLVGRRTGTSVSILAADGKSGCVGPICSLVAFFLSQMMFQTSTLDYLLQRPMSIKLVYATWAARDCMMAECVLRLRPSQVWVAYRACRLKLRLLSSFTDSRAEYRTLQGRGFISLSLCTCVALAHSVLPGL